MVVVGPPPFELGRHVRQDLVHDYADILIHKPTVDIAVQLGQNARKYAEENHDITKIVEQYKKLFMELTEQTIEIVALPESTFVFRRSAD